MAITTIKRGRPRHGKEVKTGAQRARDAKAKREREGRRIKEFVLNDDSYQLFEQLRGEAGFTKKESSEFLEALLLKVACKPWYGLPFVLPLEQANETQD